MSFFELPMQSRLYKTRVEEMADVGGLMASGTRSSFPRCLLPADGDNLHFQTTGERLVMRLQLLEFERSNALHLHTTYQFRNLPLGSPARPANAQPRTKSIFLAPIPELTTLIETSTSTATMESEKAVEYLNGLIGRTLRIHATDGRMFVGLFKCTDAVSNLMIVIEERDKIWKVTLEEIYKQN